MGCHSSSKLDYSERPLSSTRTPRCSHSCTGWVARQVWSWETELSNSRQEERLGATKNVPTDVYKQAAPNFHSRALPGGSASSHDSQDSLTPRFRSVLGQPGHGAGGRLANGVAPLSANQPIASRRRSKFERQLLALHSALSNEAPNSNQRSLTLATSTRGGAFPA